jgi:hypothetical protein
MFRIMSALGMLVVLAVIGPSAMAVQHVSAVAAAPVDIFVQIRAIGARALGTDYQCVSNCTAAGYQYALCKSKCSYPDPGQQQPPSSSVTPHGVDYQCVSDCTSKGYLYAYCKSRCSY